MLRKRDKGETEIAVGAVYRRVCAGRVVETARVLAVGPGPMGIPHVRYSVHYDRSDISDEMRTLALSSFADLFRERVRL